jgi:mannose-6-phosphate isomerase-like protein (cupin superfamily)
MGESVSIPQKCSCCQRDPDEFGHAGFLMVNGYGENVAHCRSCQTFLSQRQSLWASRTQKTHHRTEIWHVVRGRGSH